MNPNRRSLDDAQVERWIDEAAAVERSTSSPDSRAFLERLRRRLDRPSGPPAFPRRRLGWGIAAAVPLLVLLSVLRVTNPELPADRDPGDLAIIQDLELFELLDGLESELDVLEVESLLEYLENVPFLNHPDAEMLEVSG